MKKNFVFAILSALLLTTACNTMEGAGKDLQKGGARIEDSAERAREGR